MSSIICWGRVPSTNDGVPVPLVEVISGKHRRMSLAELLGQKRFALEADL